MKPVFILSLAVLSLAVFSACTKESGLSGKINTPRTNPVPAALIGRWAVVSAAGNTVYNVLPGSTQDDEFLVGYEINTDGTVQEEGYTASGNDGFGDWQRWTAYGSVKIESGIIGFYRDHGTFISNKNSRAKKLGAAELYPTKSALFQSFVFGTNGHGSATLVLTKPDSTTLLLVKQ